MTDDTTVPPAPLAVDQRSGTTLARAWEIVHVCLPAWS
jgi:hypothetical protein